MQFRLGSLWLIGLVALCLATACSSQKRGGVSADCEGVAAWHAATVARYGEYEEANRQLVAKLEAGSMTREDLQAAIRGIDNFVAIQKASNPPPAAAPMNALLIDGVERYSALFETALRGKQADGRAADAVMAELAEADKALREKCSLYQ